MRNLPGTFTTPLAPALNACPSGWPLPRISGTQRGGGLNEAKRPCAVIPCHGGSTAGYRVEQPPDAATYGQQLGLCCH